MEFATSDIKEEPSNREESNQHRSSNNPSLDMSYVKDNSMMHAAVVADSPPQQNHNEQIIEESVIPQQQHVDEAVITEPEPLPANHIPTPNIYFGTDIKGYETPIYDKVPAFTQSWLLRILYYRFHQFKYILKSDLNQCLHANLRRKNLSVNFGMRWIWQAVRYMVDVDEQHEQFKTIEWVYDDEFTPRKKKRTLEESHAMGGAIPTKIRLTEFGRKMARLIGEGVKKHSRVKPPPEQRRDTFSDNEDGHEGHSVDSMQDVNFNEYEDLKAIFAHVEALLNEVAHLRKERERNRIQQNQNQQAQQVSTYTTTTSEPQSHYTHHLHPHHHTMQAMEQLAQMTEHAHHVVETENAASSGQTADSQEATYQDNMDSQATA